jgi:hypothetical protein
MKGIGTGNNFLNGTINAQEIRARIKQIGLDQINKDSEQQREQFPE